MSGFLSRFSGSSFSNLASSPSLMGDTATRQLPLGDDALAQLTPSLVARPPLVMPPPATTPTPPAPSTTSLSAQAVTDNGRASSTEQPPADRHTSLSPSSSQCRRPTPSPEGHPRPSPRPSSSFNKAHATPATSPDITMMVDLLTTLSSRLRSFQEEITSRLDSAEERSAEVLRRLNKVESVLDNVGEVLERVEERGEQVVETVGRAVEAGQATAGPDVRPPAPGSEKRRKFGDLVQEMSVPPDGHASPGLEDFDDLASDDDGEAWAGEEDAMITQAAAESHLQDGITTEALDDQQLEPLRGIEDTTMEYIQQEEWSGENGVNPMDIFGPPVPEGDVDGMEVDQDSAQVDRQASRDEDSSQRDNGDSGSSTSEDQQVRTPTLNLDSANGGPPEPIVEVAVPISTSRQQERATSSPSSSKSDSTSVARTARKRSRPSPSPATSVRSSLRPHSKVDYHSHPLDERKLRIALPPPARRMAGGSGSGRQRKSTGPKFVMTARCLRRSDGVKRGEGEWPIKAPNTLKGRMQEIVCDACKGNCHFACAGFLEDEAPPSKEWFCPDCKHAIKKGIPPRTIEVAPQDRCIRYNCIIRDQKKIIKQEGDEDQYQIEKIIGRKAIGRGPNGIERVFLFLVKWAGYPVDESTWQAAEDLPPDRECIHAFVAECKELEISTKARVCLLPEAAKCWDADGELKE